MSGSNNFLPKFYFSETSYLPLQPDTYDISWELGKGGEPIGVSEIHPMDGHSYSAKLSIGSDSEKLKPINTCLYQSACGRFGFDLGEPALSGILDFIFEDAWVFIPERGDFLCFEDVKSGLSPRDFLLRSVPRDGRGSAVISFHRPINSRLGDVERKLIHYLYSAPGDTKLRSLVSLAQHFGFISVWLSAMERVIFVSPNAPVLLDELRQICIDWEIEFESLSSDRYLPEW